jgi:hypothetical protein
MSTKLFRAAIGQPRDFLSSEIVRGTGILLTLSHTLASSARTRCLAARPRRSLGRPIPLNRQKSARRFRGTEPPSSASTTSLIWPRRRLCSEWKISRVRVGQIYAEEVPRLRLDVAPGWQATCATIEHPPGRDGPSYLVGRILPQEHLELDCQGPRSQSI